MGKILTKEEIREVAPVCFQTEAHEKRSDKYSIISTERLIDDLASLNWNVVDAKQTRARSRAGFQKHMVSFENENVELRNVGDSKPRIVITNSFDGGSSFNMSYGIFRLICENGMVVADEIYDSLNIRHKGYSMTEVEKGVWEYIQNVPKIAEDISNYKEINLDFDQKYNFAKQALEVRYPNAHAEEDYPILPNSLLEIRRNEDKHDDLWTVMNVIQENIMRAGTRARQKGKKVKGIQSINGTIDINKALWKMMAEMYQNLK